MQTRQDFIAFLGQYTGLLERQILGVRQTLLETVDEVMRCVDEISTSAATNSSAAEQALEATYLHPDAETRILVEGMQDAVTAIFDQAQQELRGGDSNVNTDNNADVILHNRLNRFTAKFADGNAKFQEFDDTLKTSLMSIMGALSSEDVIAQRIQNIILSIKGLQASLSYVLIDFKSRCDGSELERVMSDLKAYT